MANQEHHDLGDSMQNYANPYSGVSQPQGTPTPSQATQAVNGVAPGGQMCR